MHFMGQQAISRPTRATGRMLISFAFAIWFVKYYGVPVINLNFNGLTLPPDKKYALVQWIVMLPILAAHLVNWLGDRIAYKGWNIREKITSTAGFGTDTALVSRLDSILRIVKEKIGQQSEEHIAIRRLEEIRHEVIRLNSFAGLYIYCWNLLIPIGCCFTALFWPR